MDAPLQPAKHSYIDTFDAIRAFAVLMVFVSHSGVIDLLPWPALQRAATSFSPGNFGVVLFFVLSGFLITRILIAKRGQKNAYKNFLIRRSLRIFPIYYLTILILAFIEPGQYLLECAGYISNYTFAFDQTSNPMRHTWSLCVEEHFYLFWPPIALFLTYRMSRNCVFFVFPFISIAGGILTYGLLPEHASDLFYRGSNYQIFALALGSAMAFCETWLRISPSHCYKTGVVLIGSGIAIGLLFILILQIPHTVTKFYTFSLLSGGILCFALGWNDADRTLCKLLASPVPRYIGRISYGLYLYHFPIYYFLGTLNGEHLSADRVILGTIGTFAVAILSFQFFEQPLLRLKSRFA